MPDNGFVRMAGCEKKRLPNGRAVKADNEPLIEPNVGVHFVPRTIPVGRRLTGVEKSGRATRKNKRHVTLKKREE